MKEKIGEVLEKVVIFFVFILTMIVSLANRSSKKIQIFTKRVKLYTKINFIKLKYDFIKIMQTIEKLDPNDVYEMQTGDWDLTLFTCTYNGANRVAYRFEYYHGDGDNGKRIETIGNIINITKILQLCYKNVI